MKRLPARRAVFRPTHVLLGVCFVLIFVAGGLVYLLPGPALKALSGIAGAAVTAALRLLAKRLALERTVESYRNLVDRDPLSLFYEKPPVDPSALATREGLVAAVTAELDGRARDDEDSGPVLVVGDAGTGKSIFMASLARHLANGGRVPIVVSLRDRGDERIDFEALAKERFGELVERQRLGRLDDRWWTYLRKGKRLIVLADGLDERMRDSNAHNVTQVTEAILNDETARLFPLVVTSRPDGLGVPRLIGALWLEKLTERYVEESLNGACDGALGDEEARATVRRLGLASRPLFLSVARDVCEHPAGLGHAASSHDPSSLAVLRSIAKVPDTDLARCCLLDARLDAFVAADPDQRRRTIDVVSVLALIALQTGGRSASVAHQEEPAEALLGAVAGPPLDRSHAIGPADELRFLRVDNDTVAFRHPIIQAHLAARALGIIAERSSEGREWSDLLQAGTTDEVLRALRMHAMRIVLAGDAERSERRVGELVEDLLARAASASMTANQRLTLRASAAHALGSVSVPHPHALERQRVELARLLADDWNRDCNFAAKVEAIKWLARMSGPESFQSAWHIAVRDDNYALRWEVVEAMAQSGAQATEALRRVVEPEIEACHRWVSDRGARDEDLPEGRLREMSIMAKFLPSGDQPVVSGAGSVAGSATAAQSIEALGRAVAAMTERERALGVEASLAQGLKHAARHYPLTDSNRAQAQRLAAGARFWYARIMALHALLRHAIAHQDNPPARSAPEDEIAHVEQSMTAARGDPHPWVAEAGAQGCEAVRHVRVGDLDAARAFVWHDESRQVSRSSHELAPRTSRLLADVVVMLNMNEQGRHEVVVDGRPEPHPADSGNVAGCRKCKHQVRVGTSDRLPHCLSIHSDRECIVGGGRECHCEFALCPYDFDAYRNEPHAHRGQLSAPFCARQRVIARELGPPPWQPNLPRDVYVEFWRGMEERARREPPSFLPGDHDFL